MTKAGELKKLCKKVTGSDASGRTVSEVLASFTTLAKDNTAELKAITGYDATKTQVLKNDNGTLKWVTETA